MKKLLLIAVSLLSLLSLSGCTTDFEAAYRQNDWEQKEILSFVADEYRLTDILQLYTDYDSIDTIIDFCGADTLHERIIERRDDFYGCVYAHKRVVSESWALKEVLPAVMEAYGDDFIDEILDEYGYDFIDMVLDECGPEYAMEYFGW